MPLKGDEEEEEDDTAEDVESLAVRVSPDLLVILRGSGGAIGISNRRKRTDVLDMKSFMTASLQQVTNSQISEISNKEDTKVRI